jgi:hypothetical protein
VSSFRVSSDQIQSDDCGLKKTLMRHSGRKRGKGGPNCRFGCAATGETARRGGPGPRGWRHGDGSRRARRNRSIGRAPGLPGRSPLLPLVRPGLVFCARRSRGFFASRPGGGGLEDMDDPRNLQRFLSGQRFRVLASIFKKPPCTSRCVRPYDFPGVPSAGGISRQARPLGCVVDRGPTRKAARSTNRCGHLPRQIIRSFLVLKGAL